MQSRKQNPFCVIQTKAQRTGYIDDGIVEENPNREWQDFPKISKSRKMPPLLGREGGSIVGGSVPSVHSMRAGPGRGFLAKAGVTEGETAQWGLKSQRGFNCYSFQKNTQDFLSG